MSEHILVDNSPTRVINLDDGRATTITSPRSTIDAFLQAHPDADDLQTISWNLENWRHEHESHPRSIVTARLELANMANAAIRSPADLDEVLHPDVLGYVASTGTQLLFDNKLTFQALSEQIDIQSTAVRDYISAVYMELVMRLVGRSPYDKEPFRKHLPATEHAALAPQMVAISELIPRFDMAVNAITELLLQRLKEVQPLGLLLQDSLARIEKLMNEPANPERNKQLSAEIDQFTHIRGLATGHLSHLLVQQFEYISVGRSDLEFNRLLQGDSLVAMNWQAFIPYYYPLMGEDTPEEHFKSKLISCQKTVSAWPQLESTARQLIEAARHDAVIITSEVSRHPGETTDAYAARMTEMARIGWTENQTQFQEFLQNVYKDEEKREQAPELILAEISRLCRCTLRHADRTSTMSAVSGMAAHFAISNIMQGRESNVYVGQSQEELSRKRVIICVPEDNFAEEWQFVEANHKGFASLDTDPEYLEKNGPVNTLTREQYAEFVALMEALRYLRS